MEYDEHLNRAIELIEAGRADSTGIMAYALISCAKSLYRIAETWSSSRRDFFAASALASVVGLDLEEATHQSDASYAYAAADAMLTQEEKG